MLRSLRQGFIEQHGTEPSVSLRYFEQSTSNSTISLRPGNFVNDEDADTPSTSGVSNLEQKKDQAVCFFLFNNLKALNNFKSMSCRIRTSN